MIPILVIVFSIICLLVVCGVVLSSKADEEELDEATDYQVAKELMRQHREEW